jgi:L-alanine-DL-glutamate epimerase-like enolase superfamily enzyme
MSERQQITPAAAGSTMQVTGASLYLLPVEMRVPLSFGAQRVTSVTCARVRLTVRDQRGTRAHGWGETPLSVQWGWPSAAPYTERYEAMLEFCRQLASAWAQQQRMGHPLELGYHFLQHDAPELLRRVNESRSGREPMPWLAALICCSAFDLALHDAFGELLGRPTYESYGPGHLPRDLSHFLMPAEGSGVSFAARYPADYLIADPPKQLRAWHLVGSLDPIDPTDLRGDEPRDGYPVLLPDWIARDGLTCLKIKLRGNDQPWDYSRIVRVAWIAAEHGVEWLSVDFNCTVTDPAYVNIILDRLAREQRRFFDMILYVEQPFPYDLEANRLDVRSVAQRKPLFMDESAHDWQMIALGQSLGWNGVALKTCKTQTEALLSLCWARAHGMQLMVQDLTNPMLAQIPHVLLAAHAGTIMGVETNAMQFYPEASRAEQAVHPGLYHRRGGVVDLSTVRGPGFGYRIDEIARHLPAPAAQYGDG